MRCCGIDSDPLTVQGKRVSRTLVHAIATFFSHSNLHKRLQGIGLTTGVCVSIINHLKMVAAIAELLASSGEVEQKRKESKVGA